MKMTEKATGRHFGGHCNAVSLYVVFVGEFELVSC